MHLHAPVPLHGLPRPELSRLLSEWGAPRYAGDQVFRWIWRHRATSFAEMTDLPLSFREDLARRATLALPALARRQVSADGTVKYWWTVPSPQGDPFTVESVLLPMGRGEGDHPHHYTACLSTQAGCRMKCRFCATGVPKFGRNLQSHEITAQLLGMEADAGVRFHNVVFMGMGEPLDNYEASRDAVRVLNDPQGCAIGRRRLTVSTSGLLAPLKRFIRDDWPASLAVSLHAADPTLRDELVPINRANPLPKLKKLIREFTFVRRLPATLEYVLLKGVNDRPEDAEALARFCRGLLCKVNLIRYNPVPGLPYECPEEDRVRAFQASLRERGLRVMLRERKGVDIDAACGQLGFGNRLALLPAS